MSGAGNIFAVIDNRKYQITNDIYSIFATKLCGHDSSENFRTEGMLVINGCSDENDFHVDFFNPDGSIGMMCGNGGRCAVMFAVKKSFLEAPVNNEKITFNMAGGVYQSELIDGSVKLYLPPPIKIIENVKVLVDDEEIEGTYIDFNSDHFVVDITDVDTFDSNDLDDICLDSFAVPIRFHTIFKPNGVNVNIYLLEAEDKIILRTYERGVEAETGACGTGALSTMLAAMLKNQIKLPLTIIPPSKIPLKVDLEGNFPNNITALTLEGAADIIRTTSIDLPENLFNNTK